MFGRKKKTEPEADSAIPSRETEPEKSGKTSSKQAGQESNNVPEKKALKDNPKTLSKPIKITGIVLAVILISLVAFFITKKIILPRYQHYKAQKELIGSRESSKVEGEADGSLVNRESERENEVSDKPESDRSNSKQLSLASVIIITSLTVLIASLATFFITKSFLFSKKVSDDEKDNPEQKETPIAVKVLAIALMVVIIGAAAFFTTKVVLLPRYQRYKIEKELLKKNNEEKKLKKKPNREMGQIFEIKDLTVNTFGSGGRRFVVAEFAVETHSKETYNELGVRAPQIRDMIISYLRHYTADQILSLSFQENSRSELTKNINALLHSGPIDSLYYSTLVIQ
ncbi:MAG: hypothetical protein DRP96_01005 [Candidatus Neomarinimicrobiota bacterium]|nr:MAG: hypothetical protein DRP96_01005 [Candidatus Neomarinimicrobiota bacterium]